MAERKIKITVGPCEVTAELDRSATSDLVWSALPIESAADIWGDEIYFRTDIRAEEDASQFIVDLGDIGYWPPGQALCLFFGPTPASQGDEIRPASPVNVVGKIEGDSTVLKRVSAGNRVMVEKV